FSAGLLPLFRRLDDAFLNNLAAEIPLIESLAENRFMDQLQFRERKPFRQQFETNVGIVELVSNTLIGVFGDLPMLERQWRLFRDRKPSSIRRVGSRAQHLIGGYQGVVRHGDNATPRIALGIAEGV